MLADHQQLPSSNLPEVPAIQVEAASLSMSTPDPVVTMLTFYFTLILNWTMRLNSRGKKLLLNLFYQLLILQRGVD